MEEKDLQKDNLTNDNNTGEDENKPKKKKHLLLVIVILIIAAAVAVAVYFNTRPSEVTNYPQFEEEQSKSEIATNSGSVEAGIQIPGYKSITIASGTTDVAVELVNPEENNVYFEISFYLPDVDETIYTSKLIKPGQHIYDITLNHAMDPGEYNMTVIYKTFTADDNMEPRNGAEVKTTLIVK